MAIACAQQTYRCAAIARRAHSQNTTELECSFEVSTEQKHNGQFICKSGVVGAQARKIERAAQNGVGSVWHFSRSAHDQNNPQIVWPNNAATSNKFLD